ncbi:sugar ABC transporter substrate-binding protein [Streptomyces sp. NA04227]|uniref:ABC transporter substrate-binding protein n=1 Tax=Streptomyces sp. NA04227 TaxID=2742136 RepID=UPI0015917199|nr:sugar ABC transporter substrate-binding protein [Streptomyces sp. NA04227]QKW10280.1 sugar ABC transporter substrate-binding protein [Streptomyces sp. NA04227]
MKLTRVLLCGAALLPLTLSGCAPSGLGSSAPGQLRYALWDTNQLPAYQECAKVFEKDHPGIRIKFEQKGYSDYWSSLTMGFVAETAPDVFVNHLSKYGEYITNGQMEPLDERIARDKVDTGAYVPGLAELWVGPDKKRYGLPKDWDTVALFYNEDLTREAGIDAAELASLDWNPRDGGSFEKVLARLSVDRNGVHGDEPGFDREHVRTYGFGFGDNGGQDQGQVLWSWLAAANGWTFTDKNPWGSRYRYDDPRFVEALSWLRGLIAKGYAPPLAEADSGVEASDQFGAGNYAMVADGDWGIATYQGLKGVKAGLAPLPEGPTGKRASMFNGLADSIWSGSEKKEEAWQWVKFLSGERCQNIVARHGVVFPARPEATRIAKDAFRDKGVDVTPFTTHVEKGTTFEMPVTDRAGDILALLDPALDRVLSGKSAPGPEMGKLNREVNRLLE